MCGRKGRDKVKNRRAKKKHIIWFGLLLFLFSFWTMGNREVKAYQNFDGYKFTDSIMEQLLDASEIKIGENITGHTDILENNEKDGNVVVSAKCYKFTVPEDLEGGWLTFSCAYEEGKYDNFTIADHEGDWLTSFTNISIDKRVRITGGAYDPDVRITEAKSENYRPTISTLTPGETYYAVIWSLGGNESPFHLYIDRTQDDNLGTYEAATQVPIGDTITGRLEYPEDIDCYWLQLPNDGKMYEIHMYSQGKSEVTIEDEPGKELTIVKYAEDDQKNVYVAQGEGQKLYLKIKGDAGRGNYSIFINGRENEIEPTPEPVKKPETVKKPAVKKNLVIKTLKITKCKKGTKKIVGKTIAGAKVKVTTAKKTYTVTSAKSGKFTVTLKKKLKKKQLVKITVSKKNYKTKGAKVYAK